MNGTDGKMRKGGHDTIDGWVFPFFSCVYISGVVSYFEMESSERLR